MGADRDGTGFFLVPPHDEHVRHLLGFGRTDLVADRLVGRVDLDAHVVGAEGGGHLLGVVDEIVAHGNDLHLGRREPGREVAAAVLDQHADEALQRPERGAVDHHRPLPLVVLVDVRQLEALRQVVVDLDGAELPGAAQRVLHHEVELRPVEGGLARLFVGVEVRFGDGLADVLLGAGPERVAARVLFGVVGVAERDLRLELLEAQGVEHLQGEVDDGLELVLDLPGGTEDVRVVLREAAHAGQPAELAGLLLAVDGPEFGQPHRKVPVRVVVVLVDFDVVRAVHRLEEVAVLLAVVPLSGHHRRELVVLVVRVVPAGAVEVEPPDVGGADRFVALLHLLLLQDPVERLPQRRALGQPHGQAGPHLLGVEGEEVQLRAELAVVPLLGLPAPLQEVLEQFLLGKADAVDARELRVRLVPAPVRAGHRQQLRRLNVPGRRDVWAAAEVGELALLVEGNLALLQPLDQLQLVLVALLLVVLDRVRLRDLVPLVFASRRASSTIFSSIFSSSSADSVWSPRSTS